MNWNKAHALALGSAYPYTAKDGVCKNVAGVVSTTGVTNVAASSVPALKAAIEKGPTSVTVEADKPPFRGYKSGILNDPACGTALNHAITAVGWGNSAGTDFYIVRNSWGTGWGMSGYVQIAAVAGQGICGVQKVSVWPQTN